MSNKYDKILGDYREKDVTLTSSSVFIPEYSADPSPAIEKETWVLREGTGASIPDGTPIGLLLSLTYTGNTGTGYTYQLSYRTTEGTTKRIPVIGEDWNNLTGDIITTGVVGTQEIKTDTTTASNLTITTGANKTIILTNVARLSMRPTIIFGKVQSGTGAIVPTLVDYGAISGYSLPIYNNNDEEIFFNEYIAGRWDNASNIEVCVIGYLAGNLSNAPTYAEDVNDDFALQLSWTNKATSSGVVTNGTTNVTTITNIDTGRNAQYSIYKVCFDIDWDIVTPNVTASDFFAGRLRRVAVGAGNTEITGEFVVTAIVVTYNVNKVFKAA